VVIGESFPRARFSLTAKSKLNPFVALNRHTLAPVRPKPVLFVASMAAVGAVAAVAAVAVSIFVVVPSAGAVGTRRLQYVALGDSYTSGPLIPARSKEAAGCLRSDHDYPSDTAAVLGLSLVDMSCDSATLVDMTSPQHTVSGPANPSQLSALGSKTSAVSIQIGGNDVGFLSVVENCVALTPWGPTKVGRSCKGHYDSDGYDRLAAKIDAFEPMIGSLLEQVHLRSPKAKVFVVGYPAILPATGSCWPSVPIETGDVRYLRQEEIRLDGVLRTAASRHGATYVDTYDPSLDHDACATRPARWVEPIVPASSAFPLHPNAAGEAAMARLLEDSMRAAGIG
jgi:lysophospholipase L1-like esterase